MVWLVIGIVLTMVFMQVGNRTTSANVLDYSTFMEESRQGRIAKVKMDGNRTLKAVSICASSRASLPFASKYLRMEASSSNWRDLSKAP